MYLLLILSNSAFQKGNEGCGLRRWLLYVLCRCDKLLTVRLLALKSQVAGQTLQCLLSEQDLCLEVVLPVAMFFNPAPAVNTNTRHIL